MEEEKEHNFVNDKRHEGFGGGYMEKVESSETYGRDLGHGRSAHLLLCRGLRPNLFVESNAPYPIRMLRASLVGPEWRN